MEAEADDASDITLLIRHRQLKSRSEVLDTVAAHYPAKRIPLKAQCLVEGLFAEGKI